MKRNGNQKTNRTYNPQNLKPPIPLDVDEVDAVLERFIRQKYDQQSFTSGQSRLSANNHTGSTQSSDDQPPPLPPKPGKRFGFGFRSASSAVPLHLNGPPSPPRSPPSRNRWDDQPLRVNKQSRVFGATVGGDNDNLETKLAQLKDMGFLDEKRNANVLKGLGGNLDRTIEQLVRLGERSNPSSRSRTPIQPRNVAASQPFSTKTADTGTIDGMSTSNTHPIQRTDTGSTGQQSNQSPGISQQPAFTRALSPSNPYQNQPQTAGQYSTPPWQPNGMASLDQAFSNMQVSQQPLFPNATGGYPNQAPHIQDPRLQTMTPPVPQALFHQTNPYLQQGQSNNVSQSNVYQSLHQNSLLASNNNVTPQQQMSGLDSSNPFFQSGMPIGSQVPWTASPQPYLLQQANLQQTSLPQQVLNAQQQPSLYAPQHSFTDPMQQPLQQERQQAWNPFQQQPILAQQTGRLDKTSILSLYNYPQLAPQSPSADDPKQGTAASEAHSASNLQPSVPQRSVTMPVQSVAGSRNPFQSSLSRQPPPPPPPAAASQITQTTNPPLVGRHVSQESVDIGGYQNGRHSPDAFASLSARYVR